MSEKFIALAPGFFVAPQIAPGDVAAAASAGVRLIINNRPDGEEPGQPSGAEIARAADAAGLAYVAIPVGPAGVSSADIDAFDAAIAKADGPTLAYCRSGTRSTMVRALARARGGAAPAAILSEAADAGYNLSGIASRLAALANAARAEKGVRPERFTWDDGDFEIEFPDDVNNER